MNPIKLWLAVVGLLNFNYQSSGEDKGNIIVTDNYRYIYTIDRLDYSYSISAIGEEHQIYRKDQGFAYYTDKNLVDSGKIIYSSGRDFKINKACLVDKEWIIFLNPLKFSKLLGEYTPVDKLIVKSDRMWDLNEKFNKSFNKVRCEGNHVYLLQEDNDVNHIYEYSGFAITKIAEVRNGNYLDYGSIREGSIQKVVQSFGFKIRKDCDYFEHNNYVEICSNGNNITIKNHSTGNTFVFHSESYIYEIRLEDGIVVRNKNHLMIVNYRGDMIKKIPLSAPSLLIRFP